MPTFKEDTFGSAVAGTTVRTSRALVSLRVPSAFSGTVKFRYLDAGGNIHTVQESGADLSFTAANQRVLDFGVPVSLYAECTTYGSGSCVVSIQGATLSYP